jgi:hypothetical protein
MPGGRTRLYLRYINRERAPASLAYQQFVAWIRRTRGCTYRHGESPRQVVYTVAKSGRLRDA